jgi:hypothetical protein
MDYMVSSEDLKNVLGQDLRIIKFQDLQQYNDIYQLLPKQKDYIVVFFTDDIKNGVNVGHWTCLTRYKNDFEFFDSYGLKEEDELKFISKEKRQRFNESIDYLHNLLEPVKHSNNKYDYQKWDDKINTCGRWVILKLFLFKNGCHTNKEFHNIIMRKYLKMKFKNLDLLSVYYT